MLQSEAEFVASLPVCRCGSRPRLDPYDAGWMWIECPSCHLEADAGFTLEEARSHWERMLGDAHAPAQ